MKQTQDIMGMPITVEIVDGTATEDLIRQVFDYFRSVDEKFSTYKKTSEITHINEGNIHEKEFSKDMKLVFALCEETKKLTGGYFDIVNREGKIDPSGLVKGWSIYNAAKILESRSVESFFIEAGGDIQPHGKNSKGEPWKVGVRNPFNKEEIVKVLFPGEAGVATSGTYLRGQHIYNPYEKKKEITEIVSFTVIGPNVYEADRFATAAFAMGKKGINFIENLQGFEGYSIDKNGIATMTSQFKKYTHSYA